MHNQKIILRADGNEIIGLGHVYRLFALAEILQFEFYIVFAITDPAEGIVHMLKRVCNEVLSLPARDSLFNNSSLANEIDFDLKEILTGKEIIVTDGYLFGNKYQTAVKQTGCKLVCIDDIQSFFFVADIVINPAGGITKNNYKFSADTKLLLGPSYAILRKEFYELLTENRSDKLIENLFLNFGGADPDNITCKVITDLVNKSFNKKLINVVIGSAYKYEYQLREIVKNYSFISIYKSIDVKEMIELMKQADIAICSASTVSYEFCSVTGLLFIIKTAGNQESLYTYLISEKLALPYKSFSETVHYDAIAGIKKELVNNQKKHFNGNAGKQLKKEFYKLYLKDNYLIRRAIYEDVDTYFNWANDTEVRKNSFNSDPILYETHCDWFNSNLSLMNMRLYIFTTIENTAIASIRFRIENDTATLSYLIDEKFRGIGFGKIVLVEGTQHFFAENDNVQKVIGYVKDNNLPSINTFFATGFKEEPYLKDNIRCFSKTVNISEVA